MYIYQIEHEGKIITITKDDIDNLGAYNDMRSSYAIRYGKAIEMEYQHFLNWMQVRNAFDGMVMIQL